MTGHSKFECMFFSTSKVSKDVNQGIVITTAIELSQLETSNNRYELHFPALILVLRFSACMESMTRVTVEN